MSINNDTYEALVGVFMPAYNQGHFIDEAIDSLKKQTFQNFIVHIVDDGSNDGNTTEKLRSIKYDKAKVFLNTDNKGVAFRARQHYKKLKTKYLLVLCADDVLAPTFLEKTVDYLERHKKYGAVSVNVNFFKGVPNDVFFTAIYNEKKMTLPYLLARNQVLGSSLMRKKAVDEADLSGGFVRYQDWDRWISMLEKGWRIGLIDEPLFYYRQDQGSLSHTAKIDDEMEIRKKLLEKHKENYRKYYDKIILDMEHAFLELKEGKDWLDGQYHYLTDSVEKLNKEKLELEKKIDALEVKLNNTLGRKIRRIVRRFVKQI